MATDTAPAAVPGPPEPPGNTATGGQDSKGFLASMVAPVDPARPTFTLNPTTGDTSHPADADGALDRSAPGVTSDTFRNTTDKAAKGDDAAGARHKRSIWKEMWLAAATRWAKGGGTANKRLDLKKAKAQANQIKEARTTTFTKSGGLPVRNSGGSGSGVDKGAGKTNRNSSGKTRTNSSGGHSNSTGNRSAPGAGGSHGPAGQSGGHGGKGSSGTGGKNTTGNGRGQQRNDTRGAPGMSTAEDKGRRGPASQKAGKDKPTKDNNGKNGTGAAGPAGAGRPGPAGKHGKDGSSSKPNTTTDPHNPKRKTDLSKSKTPGKDHAAQQTATKTPLQKSRETGHDDGTKTRRIVDHVKAYTDGVRDGWDDEKTRNSKEHDRLDKAHTTRQPQTRKPASPTTTEKGDDGVTTDIKPLTVQSIDANTLTLGTGSARATVGRRELRNFKQYERKLEAKETVLQQISDACVQLKKEAENEAKDCQHLTEQAKSIEGGEKLKATLVKLADDAKNQATEAAELAQQAKRAAEMCKVVLTNIQTRYQPLYKAVVDSDETKPAELRFYNDKGTYTPAA